MSAQQGKQETFHDHDNMKNNKKDEGYGMPKPDMGGYIGEREDAADEENPESMPGGGG